MTLRSLAKSWLILAALSAAGAAAYANPVFVDEAHRTAAPEGPPKVLIGFGLLLAEAALLAYLLRLREPRFIEVWCVLAVTNLGTYACFILSDMWLHVTVLVAQETPLPFYLALGAGVIAAEALIVAIETTVVLVVYRGKRVGRRHRKLCFGNAFSKVALVNICSLGAGILIPYLFWE
jgi:hypothetical protein